ncbi:MULTISPECIES: hypothetical protein [Alteromonas]|jgi:formate hydrogenlyase subunit 4|uniref:hypothetical protein n=1 Tax=Alteromonas TaxID=226 RepID=UPI001282D652|nr:MULTISPECIES: hypothetical protein [Alteromonas]MBT0588119.1 hypothetical protein [Alteromonas oceanisediminis]CAI3970920.1 hypothetical protein EZ55_04293 [Alteromonas macleodii]VTP58298.1 hypothetical protein EZ55_04293 [Alteromonas macleodii]
MSTPSRMQSFTVKIKSWWKRNVAYNNGWRLFRAYIYLVLAALAAFAGYFGWGYFGEDSAGWFGRSGAITALTASMAEALLAAFGVGNLFQGIAEVGTTKFIAKYKKPIGLGQYLGAFLIAMGTLIWAYGDLFYHATN